MLWRFAQKSLMFVHSASSYGRNKFCIEFRSWCRIFRFGNDNFWADEIVFWARNASRRGLVSGSNCNLGYAFNFLFILFWWVLILCQLCLCFFFVVGMIFISDYLFLDCADVFWYCVYVCYCFWYYSHPPYPRDTASNSTMNYPKQSTSKKCTSARFFKADFASYFNSCICCNF